MPSDSSRCARHSKGLFQTDQNTRYDLKGARHHADGSPPRTPSRRGVVSLSRDSRRGSYDDHGVVGNGSARMAIRKLFRARSRLLGDHHSSPPSPFVDSFRGATTWELTLS